MQLINILKEKKKRVTATFFYYEGKKILFKYHLYQIIV